MKESDYTKKILPEWQKQHPDARVFRNNTGMAWQGIKIFHNLLGWILKNLRPIFFGVGLPVKDKKTGHIIQKGGGDYIGFEEKTLCELSGHSSQIIFNCAGNECEDNCKYKVAVFLNLEFKSKKGKESKDQIKFRQLVQQSGGISIVLKEGEENE